MATRSAPPQPTPVANTGAPGHRPGSGLSRDLPRWERSAASAQPTARIGAITTAPPGRPRQPALAFALAMAAPHGVTAGVALLPLPDRLSVTTGLPIGMMLVLLIQVAGIGLARELELELWRRVWIVNALVCGLLIPLLALQASASQVEYVSRKWGGFEPVLWASLGTALVTLALAGLAAALSTDQPQSAGLMFAPTALAVPALMGGGSNLGEAGALQIVAETFGMAAALCFLGWLLPAGLQPLAGSVGLVAQFGLLISLGYRPSFDHARDRLVPALSLTLIAVAILTTVLVPLLSLWLRQVIRGASDPDLR